MNSETDNMKGLQLPPVKPKLPQGSTVPLPVMFAAMREYNCWSKIVIYSYTDILIVKKTTSFPHPTSILNTNLKNTSKCCLHTLHLAQLGQ